MSTTRTRKNLTGLLASVALSMIAMTGLSGAAQASPIQAPQGAEAEATASSHGCPSGAVCIYPGRGWNGGNPTYIFYSYGVHKIYNQFGTQRVYNNQYGGAVADLCIGSNGTNCETYLVEGYADIDLEPINSLRLRLL